ncbi:MAG: hypothetical protein ACOH18_03865 [Candidatus Saccharimonadaceae bacterium]
MVSPLEKYDQENESRWEVLLDIPKWEQTDIFWWIKGVVHEAGRDQWGNTTREYNADLFQGIQKKERIIFDELGISTWSWSALEESLRMQLDRNPERFLLVLETLVKYVRDGADSSGRVDFYDQRVSSEKVLRYLDKSLGNGSKWRVINTVSAKAGLEERASQQLTDVAKLLNNNDLTDAWNYAFGRESDAKLAIEKAQNAIEYYATKSGLSKATSSVYGVLLGDIKAHPEKYMSVASQQYAEQDDAVKGMNLDGGLNNMMSNWFWQGLNLIQKTNVMRHKTSDNDGYVIPIEAARQAVLIATLICEMIEKQYFKKK